MIAELIFPVPRQDLGECPLWNDRDGRLEWIDVTGKTLLSADETGDHFVSRSLDDYIGSFASRAAGGRILAYRRRIVLTDETGARLVREIPVPARDVAQERFNDGACDSRGRFWIGTMDRNVAEPLGALYRIDPDGTSHRLAEGLVLANGIAWSPDDRLLYHCDSGPRAIYVHDFDAETGTIGPRRVFVQFAAGDGMPDGCAMDAGGRLWVAAPGVGAVLCFSPDGALVERLEVPTRHPTSVGFGGVDLKTLYVTSMKPREGVADDRVDGAVFAYRMETAGLPRHPFAG